MTAAISGRVHCEIQRRDPTNDLYVDWICCCSANEMFLSSGSASIGHPDRYGVEFHVVEAWDRPARAMRCSAKASCDMCTVSKPSGVGVQRNLIPRK